MRVSHYTHVLPLKDAGVTDSYLLAHGYTGAVDLVTKSVGEWLLRCSESGTCLPEKLPESLLAGLRQRGYITDQDLTEEFETASLIAQTAHENLTSRATFVIVPTYDCNLRCDYCVQTPLRQLQDGLRKQVMNEEMLGEAFRAMQRIQPDADRTGGILIYGGEPFLPANYSLIQDITHRAARLGYKLKVITNGVYLGQYQSLIGPEAICNLLITLDGPAPVHDSRRRDPNGQSTFEAITQNIGLALSLGAQVFVRTNVDRRNVDYLGQLVSHYRRLGWLEQPNFRATFYVVRGYLRHQMESDVLLTQAELAAQARMQVGYHPRIQVADSLEPLKNKFLSLLTRTEYPRIFEGYCGAQSELWLFDANGDIYTCNDFVGQREWRVGSYYPVVHLDQEKINFWRNRTTTSIPRCRTCKYAFLCGGGCAYQVFVQEGEFYRSYCDGFQAFFHEALPRYLREYLNGLGVEPAVLMYGTGIRGDVNL